MREFFDGAVRHSPPVGDTDCWVDEWWGPGGELVVARIPRGAPIRRLDDGRPVDHLETLYRPDGTTVQYAGSMGADYQALPELMGEHWETYLAMTHK